MARTPSAQKSVVEARGWHRPVKVSLGLLPSGPDPVGEEHVRANLPAPIWRHIGALARPGPMQPGRLSPRCPRQQQAGVTAMIARGSSDEDLARRDIVRLR